MSAEAATAIALWMIGKPGTCVIEPLGSVRVSLLIEINKCPSLPAVAKVTAKRL